MKKKIKLIFFHPYSYLGGADNSLQRLIKKLDLNKFSITFISLNNSYLKKNLSKKINFITLKASRVILAIPQLRKIILSSNNNSFKKIIIISNQNFANIIAYFSSIYINKVKRIFIDRNHIDELNFTKNFNEKFKKTIIKLLMKIIYPRADQIIGVSNKLSKDLRIFVNTNVKTVYSPSFDKDIIKQSKVPIKLNENFKYLINVSRFSKRKDHYTTLKAFKIVAKKFNRIKLILVGYGPEHENIIKFAKYLNIYNKIVAKKFNRIKLILVGYGPEHENIIKFSKYLNIYNKIIIINKNQSPYPYIRKSKLLILTSLYEGFPNILVESLMLGTPVISTNMNSGASEILLNGKGGGLIKLGDYINLSKKIISFFKSPKELLRKKDIAQKKLHRFSTITHSKIYSKIFEKI